jgi:hypothetical protein
MLTISSQTLLEWLLQGLWERKRVWWEAPLWSQNPTTKVHVVCASASKPCSRSAAFWAQHEQPYYWKILQIVLEGCIYDHNQNLCLTGHTVISRGSSSCIIIRLRFFSLILIIKIYIFLLTRELVVPACLNWTPSSITWIQWTPMFAFTVLQLLL